MRLLNVHVTFLVKSTVHLIKHLGRLQKRRLEVLLGLLNAYPVLSRVPYSLVHLFRRRPLARLAQHEVMFIATVAHRGPLLHECERERLVCEYNLRLHKLVHASLRGSKSLP